MALPIKWGGSDAFTHLLIVGATRSGKTATILKPLIYQMMLAKKRGMPLGISCVEPKGDVAQMVADMAKEMDLPYTHIDPTQPDITGKFNPMEGDINSVAETTVIVLKGLFGKQDPFFAMMQESAAMNVTMLLKELHGDNMDIIDVLDTLRDLNVLKQKVNELKRRGGSQDLIRFFEAELLGDMADKYRQFAIGLRAQLEGLVRNNNLRSIMSGKSSINIDEHFETGGILAVNTALGMLRSSGDAFGQFVIMHLQNATFRRPGTEDTRIPHFLIVDEYSRYINPDVEIFLSLAAEYRVSGMFAIQSLSQLEVESGKYSARAIKNSILTNCRNKIVFGGVGMNDAIEFAEMFGKDKILMRQATYKNRILLPNLFPESFRDTESEEYRFDPTDILDGLQRFHYVHQMVQDGRLQEPGIGKGVFVPREWKEIREWEQPLIRKTNFIEKLLGMKPNNDVVKTLDDLTDEELREIEEETNQETFRLLSSEKEVQTELAVHNSEKEKHGTLHNYKNNQPDKEYVENEYVEVEDGIAEPKEEPMWEQQEKEEAVVLLNDQPEHDVTTKQVMPKTETRASDFNDDGFW